VINAIRKSLIDLKSDINFTKSDEQRTVLQPIKAAVEQLCCEEANLFTADVTMKFMLNELVEQNNDLSKNALFFVSKNDEPHIRTFCIFCTTQKKLRRRLRYFSQNQQDRNW
jgi:hypothetical protein